MEGNSQKWLKKKWESGINKSIAYNKKLSDQEPANTRNNSRNIKPTDESYMYLILKLRNNYKWKLPLYFEEKNNFWSGRVQTFSPKVASR